MNEGGDGQVHRCGKCGFVYDERVGIPDEGIAPGTPWESLPSDWFCPQCGAGKGDFRDM